MNSVEKESRHIKGVNGSIPFNMIGKQFGNWTVVSLAESKTSRTCVRYKCKCECGKIHSVDGDRLRNGKSKQCVKCASLCPEKIKKTRRCKVPDDQISNIRSLLEKGALLAEISQIYGISQSQVSRIKNYKSRLGDIR